MKNLPKRSSLAALAHRVLTGLFRQRRYAEITTVTPTAKLQPIAEILAKAGRDPASPVD